MAKNLNKLRVAWFSPLNLDNAKILNGSTAAYFTDQILPIIKEDLTLDLYSDQSGQYLGSKVKNYLSCFDEHRKDPYDVIFYQYEDSKAANFVRLHLGLIPGVTLFHDLLIKEEMPPPLTFSVWPEVVELFNKKTKELPNPYPQPDRGPFAYREVSLSPISLFSSQRLCSEARRLIQNGIGAHSNWSLPKMMPIALPASLSASLKSLNESDQKCNQSGNKVIAFVGSPAIEYRSHKILEAISNLNNISLHWLVDTSEKEEAQNLLNEYNFKNAKLVTDRSPLNWSEVVSKADIALHTLFSVYGTPGPYLPISFSHGVPTIVTNFAEGEYLPQDLVFKITPGDKEAVNLRETISQILLLPDSDLALIKNSLKTYAEENFNPEIIACELKRVFIESAPYLKEIWVRWNEMENSAESKILVRNYDHFDKEVIGPIFRELGWDPSVSLKGNLL